MQKHKFNILPAMGESEFVELVDNMRQHGFDATQPIVVYQGGALDGWHRWQAAFDAGVEPVFREFVGTDMDAIEFVLRVNIRRNLSSQQRAAVAVEADELIQILTAAVHAERRKNQVETLKATIAEKTTKAEDPVEIAEQELVDLVYETDEFSQVPPEMVDESLYEKILTNSEDEILGELSYEMEPTRANRNKSKVSHKLAKRFNTNSKYVETAMKLKETAPEKLEEIKAGTTTFQQIKREEEAAAAPLIDENDTTRDKFTALAATLSKTLHTHFHAIQDAITAAKGQFIDHDQKFEDWCDHLPGFNPELFLIDVKKLKNIKVCVYCEGKKCPMCKESGYLSGTHHAKSATT